MEMYDENYALVGRISLVSTVAQAPMIPIQRPFFEDIVVPNAEMRSTNAREFALTARSYARFPNNYVDLDESSKQAALERQWTYD